MSLAGIRSNRGDTYQRSVALYLIVEMLLDGNIAGLQVDAVALPNENYLIYGDDIVITFSDGKKRFLQAKVNQSNHQFWSLTDAVLKKELISAKNQLLADPSCDFYFYSRTPFNVLQRLVEEVNVYPDHQSFHRVAPKGQKDTLNSLAKLWDNEQLTAFNLVKRIGIGDHHSSDEWQRHSLRLIKTNFSQPETALELIYNYVDRQHSKLGNPCFLIDRKDVLDMLEKHGIYSALGFNEQVLLEKFRAFSLQGRQWVRTIGGFIIDRPELELLKQAVTTNKPSVLLEDVAGGGKTCILLDLMDYLDKQDAIATLFIKGDLFASIDSLNELSEFGLPEDFLAQCAHLAGIRQLIIILDSLDVLAVGRSHKSLQSFLGLIANLNSVPNITIIAASRSFDAKYDPLLREVSWAETVTVKPLSYKDDISPLLTEWGINPNDINSTLQSLLVVPQNLRLFYVLIQKGMTLSDIEEHDLYDLYIQELIEKDQNLGVEVVNELQNIAIDLLKIRSYKFPKNSLKVSAQKLQRLQSQEIITEISPHQLMFSHQTLADALRIRQAQKNGVDLHHFVISQPQLPFIRPAVRSFILSLRLVQPDQFTKQMRKLLLEKSISMHLKRLSVETLAEMVPREDDLLIVTVLSSRLPTLFSRFLDRANSEEWFGLLYDKWLVKVNISSIGNIIGVILQYVSKFLDGHEESLITLWDRALDEQWLPTDSLVWSISSDLKKLKRWDIGGVTHLLKKLLGAKEKSGGDVGHTICKYIEATGTGDELLWQYILRDSESITNIRRGRELKLNCRKHDLLNEDFLEKRLKNSDILFGSAMDYLLQFSQDFNPEEGRYPFESSLLDSTSYNRRHTNWDHRHQESIHEFLDAIESAMKFRATTNDSCWKKYEPRLRNSRELGVQYLLCETYLTNIPDHLEGIEHQLTNGKLLRYGHLEYELGMLTAKAYPLLSYKVQEDHQRLLLELYDDVKDKYDWTERVIYKHLVWIPSIFRLAELKDYYEKCEKKYGTAIPNPAIRARGGFVKSPVSTEKLIELSHGTLIKLLNHYDSYDKWEDGLSGPLIGGRESLESSLRTAASWVPMLFIPLVPMIADAALSISFIYSIIDGLSLHLRCRFSNLSSSDWKSIEPLPDGRTLSVTVLDLVERFCRNDDRRYTTSQAIEACSEVLYDNPSLERICFQIWLLGLHKNPESEKDEDSRDLVGSGINSIRGIAAESVLKMCNNLLENQKPITDELRQLLFRYAKDPSIVVRATFLRRFPYFHSKEAELGWELLTMLIQNYKPRLLKHFERTLYYKYHANFNLVKPYLNLLETVDDEKSSAAWGRLVTLSFLSGHINEEGLWQGVDERHEATREGMGQVFVANINRSKSTTACIKGLSRLMKNDGAKSVFSEFESSLEDKDRLRFVPFPLVKLFIDNAPAEHVREIDGVFYWLEQNVLVAPNRVLEILEGIINKLSDISGPIYFHRPVALIATLKLLLQEADLSDDNEFINKVLYVQDWFLDHGVKELETLLDTA